MASASEVSDGPVLSLMNKRLRALRKKYNRIIQMEENVSQGKPLNKEQEDVLRSKPAVCTLIDEYEKLRQPLSTALQEELSLLPPKQDVEGDDRDEPRPELRDPDAAVEDLLNLLYFGCLFDVKPQSDFTSTMLTRTHERGCCLTYDYVTDDATDLLGERDLDMISVLGALVTSRPVHAGVSHKNALRGCIEHAKLWLRNSDRSIEPGSSLTYSELRMRLNKILASDYFTTTPEMKAPVDVAAAVGKYAASQVKIPDSTTVPSPLSEGASAHYQHKEDGQEDFEENEIDPDQSSPVDEPPKDEADDLNHSGDIASDDQEQQKLQADLEEQNQRGDAEFKEQQYIPRRAFQNQRGGTRGGGNGGGRRGYANGRGGRGGRGGGAYQNGRSQYYDPGYYPRNYYNTRGRGGRSGGSAMQGNHGAATHGGHVPANVELDASA